MKITNKIPKSNEKLHIDLLDNDWIILKEPSTLLKTILVSIPFMLLAFFITAGVINFFSKLSLKEYGFTADSFSITIRIDVIIWIFLTVAIHELIHLLFVPNFIKSSRTSLGLTFFGGFVYTEEEITRRRYLVITIAPFVILSIFLPFALGLMGFLTPTIKFFILLNAVSSSVDVLNLFFILTQVPRNSVVRSNGMKTYWKTL